MSDWAATDDGALAPEAVIRLIVNDRHAVRINCTPHNLDELAAGWLVCEGIVTCREDLLNIEPLEAEDAASVSVRLGDTALGRFRDLLDRASGCVTFPPGPMLSDESVSAGRNEAGSGVRELLEDRDRLASLFGRMFDRAALRDAVGGVHTGGMVCDGELVAVVEDVSRHHVVDRIVGNGWIANRPFSGAVLLLSSRISGAMAAKACRAGVAALVSRSIPTDLAAGIARSCGLILVGRAQRESPSRFWPGT